MKAERDACKQRFQAMSDEALMSVGTEDLVPIARECYDDEVRRRGLSLGRKIEEPPVIDAPEEVPTDGGVELARFQFQGEAAVAQSVLESAGIPSYLANEHTLTANWFWTNAIGGLVLIVPASELEAAREILANGQNEVPPES